MKKCSENMQQIYRKTFMPKCDFNKVAKKQKHLWRSLFNKVSGVKPTTLLKKETLAQMFSCEFCEISKNTFTEHLWATASGYLGLIIWVFNKLNVREKSDIINSFAEKRSPIGFLIHCCDFLKSEIYYFVLTCIYHSTYFSISLKRRWWKKKNWNHH